MGEKADKELQTLEAIGWIYCRAHHRGASKDAAGLCAECRETVDATAQRAAACPYGHEANCQDCETHCQRGEAQDRIRAMMRYAAPRMALRHPLMTVEYLRRKRV